MQSNKRGCEKDTIGLLRIPVVILLFSFAWQAPLAWAEDKNVGGHVGFGFPLVTKDGDNLSSLADNFQMELPIAITVNGPGRMYFDLELVPVVVDKRNSTCCKSRVPVAAGAWLCSWKPGGILGEFGPDEDGAIRNHAVDRQESWPIEHTFFKGYFVEGDFIFRFNRPVGGPATNPFIFNVVLGLSS